jgi:hypothetical protein
MREKIVFTVIDRLLRLGTKISSFHRSQEGAIKYFLLLGMEICIVLTILLTGLIAIGIGVDPLHE